MILDVVDGLVRENEGLRRRLRDWEATRTDYTRARLASDSDVI